MQNANDSTKLVSKDRKVVRSLTIFLLVIFFLVIGVIAIKNEALAKQILQLSMSLGVLYFILKSLKKSKSKINFSKVFSVLVIPGHRRPLSAGPSLPLPPFFLLPDLPLILDYFLFFVTILALPV